MTNGPVYELFHWPSAPGLDEFVRLLFEETRTPYLDVGRLPEDRGGGVAAIERFLRDEEEAVVWPPFAPPILRVEGVVVAQVANICAFLARRFRLVPDDERSRLWANQLQLTILDLVHEAQGTHHPLGSSRRYETQRRAARRRAKHFLTHHLPKFFGYFEHVLARNPAKDHDYLMASGFTYVDLTMAQTLRGLEYAFPRGYAKIVCGTPRLIALRDAVESRQNIDAYLSSARCLPFNEEGIFRYYPELDLED